MDGHTLIRLCSYDEIEFIASSSTVSKSLGRKATTSKDYDWFLADVDGAISGFGAVQKMKTGAWIRSAYVLPMSRMKGIYRELLNARVRHCVDIDASMITCISTNDSYSELLRQGFVQIGNRGKYAVMRKHIKNRTRSKSE